MWSIPVVIISHFFSLELSREKPWIYTSVIIASAVRTCTRRCWYPVRDTSTVRQSCSTTPAWPVYWSHCHSHYSSSTGTRSVSPPNCCRNVEPVFFVRIRLLQFPSYRVGRVLVQYTVPYFTERETKTFFLISNLFSVFLRHT
jgi:hypothetical protein